MWWFVAALFPSFRGLVCLFFVALGGWWFLGDHGAAITTGALLLAAMIRPQASPWLRETLNAGRALCWLMAGLMLTVGAGRMGFNPQTVIRAAVFALLGLPFHLRLWSLDRPFRTVPAVA